MPKNRKYSVGEFLRDFLTTAGQLGTCAVSYAIAKEQPAMAGIVFIVGTIGTRGIRKEVQAKLLSMASDRLNALTKSLEEGKKKDDGR